MTAQDREALIIWAGNKKDEALGYSKQYQKRQDDSMARAWDYAAVAYGELIDHLTRGIVNDPTDY